MKNKKTKQEKIKETIQNVLISLVLGTSAWFWLGILKIQTNTIFSLAIFLLTMIYLEVPQK